MICVMVGHAYKSQVSSSEFVNPSLDDDGFGGGGGGGVGMGVATEMAAAQGLKSNQICRGNECNKGLFTSGFSYLLDKTILLLHYMWSQLPSAGFGVMRGGWGQGSAPFLTGKGGFKAFWYHILNPLLAP